MNLKSTLLVLVIIAVLVAGCQRPPFWADDDSADDGAAWELLNYHPENHIQGLFATDYELYAITEKSFSRLNSSLQVIEQRTLPFSISIPALSDNTFVRLTTNEQNRQVVEFRSASNGDEVFKVLADTLPVPQGNSLDIETLANALGTFSNDGTLFLLAGRILPARYYSLYLFDIKLNAAHNAFVNVKMVKRIDLTDLDANAEGVIKSLRFHHGNFYVTTQQGAWRITPSGIATQLFAQWKEDSFSWLGDLYMTGTVDYDLHKSIDNGVNWEPMNIASELRHVVTADTSIFTQEVTGRAFSVMPKDFKKAHQIVYPTEIDPNAAVFYGLTYFNDRYYFAINKDIYATSKVITK